MENKQGRPREYKLSRPAGFKNSEIAVWTASVIEAQDRVIDQVNDLPQAALDFAAPGTTLSVGRLVLHLAWAEVGFIGRFTGNPAPGALVAEVAPGALADFDKPAPAGAPASALADLVFRVRTEFTLPTLAGITDPDREIIDPRGLKLNARGGMAHLLWHWVYHSGQIGLVRLQAGYDYTWTFGAEVKAHA